jgi:hypothetical protein
VLGSNTAFKKGFLGCIVGLSLLHVNADTPKPKITQVFENTCCPCLLLKIVYKDTKTLQPYTNRNYLQTLLKMPMYYSLCLRRLSFTNRASEANVVKWKVSKRASKNFTWLYMNGRAYVCLSICLCLSVCLSVCQSWWKNWITFDWMKGSWWSFQDLSNSFQVIFGWGCQISWTQGYGSGPKQHVSRKYISFLSFCPAGVCHTFLETLGPGLKSPGSRILNFGVGPKILGPEWEGTCQFFVEFRV